MRRRRCPQRDFEDENAAVWLAARSIDLDPRLDQRLTRIFSSLGKLKVRNFRTSTN